MSRFPRHAGPTAATALAALLTAGPASAQAPAAPPASQGAIEEVLRLDNRPGNPAVSADGRLFFSMHPFGRPEYKLMERRADGTAAPYPSPAASRDGFAAVIGLRIGADGVLWVLDMGSAGQPPKLVGWNTRTDALEKAIALPDAAVRPNSFLQDFALDQRRGLAYIADTTMETPTARARPAIVVVDLKAGTARRLLEDHPSFRAEPVDMTIDGRRLTVKGLDGAEQPFRLSLDPVTIDPAYEWVYFGPMNGRGLYRVPAAALADAALSADALAGRIQRYGEKRSSDGISIDGSGNVYVTDVEAKAIGVANAQGYRVLAQDDRLVWPDGLAVSADGWIYATVNQLNRASGVNAGEEAGRPPYLIVRTRALAPSAVGR